MVGVETMWIYVIVAVVILAGGIAFAVSLTRGRGGESRRLDRDSGPVLPGEDLDAQPLGGDGGDTFAPPGAPGDGAEVETSVAVLEPSPVQTAPAEPAFERPDSARGRLARLRARLARSNTALGKGLLALLSRGKLDEEAWEEVEDTLIASDLGVDATTELVDSLRTRVKVDGTTDEATVREWLREDLLRLVQPDMDRRIASSRIDGRPAVVLVVGVNGTGKTTTVGKLARVFVAEAGVVTVRSDKDGADPAAVAFDAVKAGIEEEVDVVIIDTAGRLHNKVDLMNELGKVKRVIEKQSPIDEVLLVLDATTGQNGLMQAKVFAEAVNVTGIVLTKLDGTAKGGIVVAVQRQLGVPVKLVGLGEGPDDLAPFDPEAFVDAIVS